MELARQADVLAFVALFKVVWEQLPGVRQALEEQVVGAEQALHMKWFRCE